MRAREPKAESRTNSAQGNLANPRPSVSHQTCGKRLRQALRQPKALCALLPVQRKRRALAGGKAHECLQRKLIRPARRLQKLNQLCAWAEKPTSLPRLREGPLAGHYLEDLVTAQRTRPETKPSSPARATTRNAYPASLHRQIPAHGVRHMDEHLQLEPWAFRNFDQSMRLAKTLSHPLPVPYELALRAGNELLQRFGLHLAKRRSHQTLTFTGKVTSLFHRKSSGRLPIGPPWTDQQMNAASQYIARMANRFSYTWKRLLRYRFGTTASGAMPLVFSISSTWAQASLSTTLVGPAATLDMLLRWIRQERSVEIQTSERNTSRAHEPTGRSDVPVEPIPRPGVAASRQSVSESAQQGFYPQVGSLPLPAASLNGGQSLFAPPLATEIPPTLLPPLAPFDAPTPLASATLRHEALRDETDLVQEDLDFLADKIKRILDEEARRHGIQV